jgi:hypothetical protein
MKTNVFYVTEELLIETLRKYGKGSESKDYEYAISVYAKRVFEKRFKQPFTITFETNSKYTSGIRSIPSTPEEVIKVLRELLQENTSIDFGLASGTPGNFEGHAYGFQVKRFKSKVPRTIMKDLKKFIEIKANKYRSPDTGLIIVPDLELNLPNDLSLRQLSKEVNIANGSLKAALILVNKNSEPELIQIWPNYGEY